MRYFVTFDSTVRLGADPEGGIEGRAHRRLVVEARDPEHAFERAMERVHREVLLEGDALLSIHVRIDPQVLEEDLVHD